MSAMHRRKTLTGLSIVGENTNKRTKRQKETRDRKSCRIGTLFIQIPSEILKQYFFLGFLHSCKVRSSVPGRVSWYWLPADQRNGRWRMQPKSGCICFFIQSKVRQPFVAQAKHKHNLIPNHQNKKTKLMFATIGSFTYFWAILHNRVSIIATLPEKIGVLSWKATVSCFSMERRRQKKGQKIGPEAEKNEFW